MKHLLENNLLRQSQHGFMSKKSCTTNLLEFLEIVTKAVDEGNAVDAVFLDFAKAFDKVPRKRLLSKLRAHGVAGNLLRWIANWLMQRRQRVVLNGRASGWQSVLSGVPQGSVLGPILFLIFINNLDVQAALITTVKKFADDTKLGQVVRTDQDRIALQNCLNKLTAWADTWGM
jgi:ribonuclease P/MRP protein subunit RPP40